MAEGWVYASLNIFQSCCMHLFVQTLTRNLDSMLNSLIDVFFERSGVSLQKEVAVVIALIGQHLSNESYPFFQVCVHNLVYL